MPSSCAASASARFTAVVSGCPPVMDDIIRGNASLLPRNVTSVLISPLSISGSAVGIRNMSSNPDFAAMYGWDSTSFSAHRFRCSIFLLDVDISQVPFYIIEYVHIFGYAKLSIFVLFIYYTNYVSVVHFN